MSEAERIARAALERIAALGNDGKLPSCEEYVRRADEIAVEALARIEALP